MAARLNAQTNGRLKKIDLQDDIWQNIFYRMDKMLKNIKI